MSFARPRNVLPFSVEREDQVRFISIPRCASHSILSLFPSSKRYNHRSVRNLVVFGGYLTPSFAVIRNPIERAVSWYKWHRAHERTMIAANSFEEWVEQGCPHHWTFKTELDTVNPLNQADFVQLGGEVAVSRLLLFERLSSDFDAFTSEVGLSPGPIPRMAPSTGSNPKIDTRTLSLLESRFAADFELWQAVRDGNGSY